MDQVHVIRHKVLVEGRSARQVATEFGISRRTVRKYLTEAVPIRRETHPRPRPVWETVRARVEQLLTESVQWTGGKQRLTATRLHELLIAEGKQVGVTMIYDKGGPNELVLSHDGPEWELETKRLFPRMIKKY